jgi:hypothetical protein
LLHREPPAKLALFASRHGGHGNIEVTLGKRPPVAVHGGGVQEHAGRVKPHAGAGKGPQHRAEERAAVAYVLGGDHHLAVAQQLVECLLDLGDQHRLPLRRSLGGHRDLACADGDDPVWSAGQGLQRSAEQPPQQPVGTLTGFYRRERGSKRCRWPALREPLQEPAGEVVGHRDR